jgi:hypothetical protein
MKEDPQGFESQGMLELTRLPAGREFERPQLKFSSHGRTRAARLNKELRAKLSSAWPATPVPLVNDRAQFPPCSTHSMKTLKSVIEDAMVPALP